MHEHVQFPSNIMHLADSSHGGSLHGCGTKIKLQQFQYILSSVGIPDIKPNRLLLYKMFCPIFMLCTYKSHNLCLRILADNYICNHSANQCNSHRFDKLIVRSHLCLKPNVSCLTIVLYCDMLYTLKSLICFRKKTPKIYQKLVCMLNRNVNVYSK